MNIGLICARRINKMRENCLEQFEAHWNCLELNNQACPLPLFFDAAQLLTYGATQEYFACRKPERTLNKCMFEKLVRPWRASQ